MEKRKRTIYIDQEIDKQMRVAAVEDDMFYGQYAEEAFRSVTKSVIEAECPRGDAHSG
jgi:hypothetical protein